MEAANLMYLVIIGIGIFLLLIVSILLIFNTSRKRVLSEISERQQQELEFQQNLLKNNVETQERERSRISKELHDDIGSTLNVVNLSCNMLEATIANGNDPEIPLNQIRTSLNESIVRIRELAHVLYPPVLEKFGLQSALQSLVLSINRTGQVKINLEVGKDWGQMTLNEELNIYRLLQELINNTIKHAQASTIYISSNVEHDTIQMIYKDDGIGLPEDISLKEGMGMGNIRTRTTLLNADLEIKTELKKGVEFIISIPVKK